MPSIIQIAYVLGTITQDTISLILDLDLSHTIRPLMFRTFHRNSFFTLLAKQT